MTAPSFAWPDGKKIAVSVMVLLETWSDGKGAPYSVQTTSLKPGTIDHSGIAWGRFGGNEGIWRIIRILDHYGVRGTFCPNARSAELYSDAIRHLVDTGHEVAGHGYYQDELMVYMSAEEEQRTIRRSLDLLTQISGKRPTGWASPVLAWSENTFDLLVQEGLVWHSDAKDIGMPQRIKTRNGAIMALPVSDFADNRVLRSSPRDFYDVYKDTFDYLYEQEPMSMLPLAMHCHWGGRPLMSAMLFKILNYMRQFPDVWFATSGEIAAWCLKQGVEALPYKERFFNGARNGAPS
jgi:peptidoglycan/xylan/chitin deacetylase (PgdA/CDA1 family)